MDQEMREAFSKLVDAGLFAVLGLIVCMFVTFLLTMLALWSIDRKLKWIRDVLLAATNQQEQGKPAQEQRRPGDR